MQIHDVIERLEVGKIRNFKEKYYSIGLEIFSKNIEHPNPGSTFAPKNGNEQPVETF